MSWQFFMVDDFCSYMTSFFSSFIQKFRCLLLMKKTFFSFTLKRQTMVMWKKNVNHSIKYVLCQKNTAFHKTLEFARRICSYDKYIYNFFCVMMTREWYLTVPFWLINSSKEILSFFIFVLKIFRLDCPKRIFIKYLDQKSLKKFFKSKFENFFNYNSLDIFHVCTCQDCQDGSVSHPGLDVTIEWPQYHLPLYYIRPLLGRKSVDSHQTVEQDDPLKWYNNCEEINVINF